jgi:hypothetical protein
MNFPDFHGSKYLLAPFQRCKCNPVNVLIFRKRGISLAVFKSLWKIKSNICVLAKD